MSAMVCPKCKAGEDVVALEDGVWMCTKCVIEFNEDGRARGGEIEVGKIGYILDEPINEMFVATVSVSAPKLEGNFAVWEGTISLKSVGNIDEMLEELYESLKRASK